MRALRFSRTGSLDYLEVATVAKPQAASSEVLIEVKAAAINPSDAKNVLGRMHETTVPRIPGRDFAGIVRQGPPEWMDRAVFGTGGNIGFGRDGSHAEFLAVPEAAIVAIPSGLSFAQAAAIALPYVTATTAVVGAALLKPGETILILGTNGAVGGAAARIAHRIGAQVIGVVRAMKDLSKGAGLPVDAWIELDSMDLAAACRELTEGRGADVVFDTVGGPVFESCLAALARRGRQLAIASVGAPRVTFSLVDFYHNESRLFGADSLKVGVESAAEMLRGLVPAFDSGEFPAPEVTTAPLERGPEIYRQIDAGQLHGKFVLTP